MINNESGISTKKNIPEIKGTLRNHYVEIPEVIRSASGIKVFGKRIKSLIFTTDVAIIKNTNADAIIAVYPFTPQPVITQALLLASDIPVFCGVGGGITTGKRVINLALDAEFKGALGVVLNSPTSNEVVSQIRDTIDIPVIVTVVSEYENFEDRIKAGTTIFNVSGAKSTTKIVRKIRESFPNIPIIATGGPNDETIRETIAAGANAITYTPPTNLDIFKKLMSEYRERFAYEASVENNSDSNTSNQ